MPPTPLTKEETLWIRNLTHALRSNEEFTTPAPTEHAIVYVFNHISGIK